MTRLAKRLAVTGVTGVTGVLDEPIRARESVTAESGPQGSSRARIGLFDLPVTPVTEEKNSTQESTTTHEKGVTGSENLPVTGRSHRSQPPAGLDVPVAAWADLPAPSSIRVRTATGRTAWFTAARRRLQEARAAGEAVFGPNEYETAVAAVLEGAAPPQRIDDWIDRKLAQPGWVLTPGPVFGQWVGLHSRGRVRPEVLGARTWATVLERCGLEVLEVLVEDGGAPAADVTPQELAAL